VAHGLGPGMVRVNLRRLEQLGFVTIERGAPNGVARTTNTLRLSWAWRDLDEAAAKRLAQVSRWKKPRTVRLLRAVRKAAENGNAEALAVWREMTGKKVHKPDADNISIDVSHARALARLKHERPDLFDKVRARGKPKQQPKRRDFADDAAMRRVFRIGRPGQRRASGPMPAMGARAVR
jgi:hypothetical protein